MKKDRTDFDMEVEFTHPETDEKEKEYVYIPFTILVEAIRQYCDKYEEVKVDGTDTDIWNLFIRLECLDKFVEEDSFIDICKDLYKDSNYQDEDFEEWKDEYDFSHDLGEYISK